jgi:transcriptional regulator with XRE-family HTH domain
LFLCIDHQTRFVVIMEGTETDKLLSALREGDAAAANEPTNSFARFTSSISQQQLADRLGLTQRAYAHWERNPVALRPDQLLSLAEALNVSVEDLVGSNGTKKRGTGPTGKMKQLFEAASQLPRSQQQKLTAVLEAFVNQHAAR